MPTPTPTVEELLQRIAALEAVVATLTAQVAEKDRIIAAQAQQIAAQAQQIAEQDATIARLLRWRFGARTEKSTTAQEGQVLIALEGLTCELTQTTPPAPAPTTSAAASPRMPGRRPLWSAVCPHLPVDDVVIDLPAAQRQDTDGTVLVRHGSERREELVYLPGCLRIRRVIRHRYGRSDTGEKIAIAPNPDRIVPRGTLADETLLAAVVHHASDCLPFHRQAEMLARLGAPVTRQSLTQGFHAWCALAEPLVDAMQQQIQQAEVVHVDGSFVFRQNRDRSRRCTRSPVYALTDGDQVVLRWRPDERHATAADLIPGYRGFLIHDEWPGWRKLQQVIATHGGCNAHARRPVALVQDTDADARRMIALYAQLFAIEAQARASGRTGLALIDLRRDLRRAHSVAVMDAIEAFARELTSRRTGSLATAAQYILTHREDLRRFLADGRLPPDNNLAERVLRRNALLRRNRPFFVAEHGGTSLATALSIGGSCRLLELNPLDYLIDCLPVLLAHRAATASNTTPPDLAAWTPAAYAARQPAKTAVA